MVFYRKKKTSAPVLQNRGKFNLQAGCFDPYTQKGIGIARPDET